MIWIMRTISLSKKRKEARKREEAGKLMGFICMCLVAGIYKLGHVHKGLYKSLTKLMLSINIKHPTTMMNAAAEVLGAHARIQHVLTFCHVSLDPHGCQARPRMF